MRQVISRTSCLFASGIALVFIAFAAFGLSYLAPSTTRSKVIAIAQTLGYTDDALLIAYGSCWDLSSHCGYRVIYTIPDSLDTFQNRMSQQSWMSSSPSNSSYLFTDVRLETAHTFTADGKVNNPPVEDVPSDKMPNSYGWSKKGPDGKEIYVYVYDTATRPVAYAFDKKRITGNIVEIFAITR